MVRLILLGAPGAGKGTQADAIEVAYGYIQISTGDLIRAEVSAATDIGLRVKAIMEKGELVSDDIVLSLLEKRLKKGDIIDGYILDGYPRTRSQAEALSRMPVDREIVIYLEVDEEVVVKRLLSRLTCSACGEVFNTLSDRPRLEGKCDRCGGRLMQRSDDNENTIRNRIAVYKEKTHPVIDYYREQGSLLEIDAALPIEAVFAAVKGVLG